MPVGISHIQYGDHYPLVDPSPDIQFLIADMTVSHEDPRFEYDLPLRIARITPKGHLRLETCSGQPVLDSEEAEILPFGAYTLYTWTSATVQVKMVINNQRNFPDVLLPEHAVLDLRAVYCVPPRIRTVNGHSGRIEIAAGTNIQLGSTPREDFRSENQLTLDAVPGAGTGKVTIPCEEVEKKFLLRSINGVKPNSDGAVFLPTVNGQTLAVGCGHLQLANTNEPCCTCEDMTAFAEYLNKVADAYREIGGKARWLREQHDKLVKLWQSIPDCTGTAAASVIGLAQSCPLIEVRAAITNLHSQAASFIKINSHAEILEGEGSLKLVRQIISNYQFEGNQVPQWVTHYDPEQKKLVRRLKAVFASEGTKTFSDVSADSEVYLLWQGHYDEETNEREAVTEANRTLTNENGNLIAEGDTKTPDLFEKWFKNSPFMEWYCVPAGETVYWHGIYQIILDDKEETFSENYRIQFTLDSGHIDFFAHGSEIPLEYRQLGGPYLSGTQKTTVNLNCVIDEDSIMDPAPRKEDAETIRKKIFEIKQRYWPCKGEEEA